MLKMKIKSFIAPNIEIALEQIRKEIGQSALILETRKCDGKGFKGFLGKSLVEVIAAYEDDSEDDVAETKPISVTKVDDNNVPTINDSKKSILKNNQVEKSRTRMLTLLNESKKERLNEGIKYSDSETETTNKNLKQEQPAQMSVENIKKVNGDQSVKHEINKLKADLLSKEINMEVVGVLLDSVVKEKCAENDKLEVNKININKKIANMIHTEDILENSNEQHSKKIIAFVGPTGVGKTTTLAKVASKLAIDNNKNVGVITIDTYRIAAVDQLMAYAEMIDIPVRIAHTSKELAVATNEFEDKDYILIDTVGRSQYDDKRIRMLRGLLKILPSLRNYLVISSNTRNKEARDIFTNFNILPLHGFIFTKTDETRNFGMLLNMTLKTSMPICYLTNGQEVPDDILDARSNKIADLVFPY